MWGVPSTREKYRKNPLSLISFMLEHKGQGSLFTYLQDKGWASSTSASTRTTFEDFTIFETSISLSPTGLEHWKEVVQSVYQYIAVIRSTPDEEMMRMWAEMKACHELDFQFQEKAKLLHVLSSFTVIIIHPDTHALSL